METTALKVLNLAHTLLAEVLLLANDDGSYAMKYERELYHYKNKALEIIANLPESETEEKALLIALLETIDDALPES